MLYSALTSVCGLLLLSSAAAHGRWKCPLPRDANDENGNHITFDNTGNKYAACGPQSGKYGFGTITTLYPGWTTLTWEESIAHTGSPFRIAIMDASETARIVLLDHIPHNEQSFPDRDDESSYVEYKISVNIPDVDCAQCVLQLLYVMTDKTVACDIETCYYNPDDAACKGSTDPEAESCPYAPNDEPCVMEDECFSNYHSCTDVVIRGKQPMSAFAFDSQPEDWPYKSLAMNYYTAEVGKWENGWLQGIPTNYTTTYDSLVC